MSDLIEAPVIVSWLTDAAADEPLVLPAEDEPLDDDDRQYLDRYFRLA